MESVTEVHYSYSGADCPPFPDDETIVIMSKEEDTHITILSDKVLVKYRNVSLEEYRNQVEARNLVDPGIVRIPQVYRCFSHKSNTYLVMELIDGVKRDKIEDLGSIRKVARIIEHLQTFRGTVPGPLGGGLSRGLLWENEETELRTVSRLNEYSNRRLVLEHEVLRFKADDLVLNHNDIAPRNIIWMPDGSVCLLDWKSAGYYPRLVERVVLLFNTQEGRDLVFTLRLAEELGSLSEYEEHELALIHQAWFNGHRYFIKPLDEIPRSRYEPPPAPLDYSREAFQSDFMDAKTLSDALWQDLHNDTTGNEIPA